MNAGFVGSKDDLEAAVHDSREESDESYCGSANPIAVHKPNINVRAAFIHVLGDFIQSIGVFIAAIVIYFEVCPYFSLFTQVTAYGPNLWAVYCIA